MSRDAQTSAVLVLPQAEGVWARAARLPLELQCARLLRRGCSMLLCERVHVPGYIR